METEVTPTMAPADTGTTATTTTTTTPPAEAPVVDPFDNAETTTFSRDYVHKLREEAAGHRTSAKAAKEAAERYSNAFGGWDESDADVLLDVLTLAAKDPKEGSKAMAEIAKLLAGDTEETPVAPKGDAPALTQADVERVLNEREQKIRLETAVQDVEKEAVALGYEPGTADYFKLLWLTKEKHKFDMKAAHKAMEDEAEAKYQKYLAKKVADVDTEAGAGPSGGGSFSDAKPVTSIKDASARTRERIAKLNGR